MLEIDAILTISEREIIRYWRDKARIFTSLFQPLMFFVIFGSGLRNTITQANFGFDFVQFMYPGIIAMSLMSVAFFSTISTVWDREFGFLKEILVAPVSRTSIALGKTLGATIISSLQALILLLIAPLVEIRISFYELSHLIFFMLLLSFAISGIGLFFASVVKTIENFGVIMNVIVFPMFFLSGAFFPLNAVPGWMSVLSKINPLTYGVDAFRQILLASQVPPAILQRITVFPVYIDALFLLVFSVAMIFAAVIAFNRRD